MKRAIVILTVLFVASYVFAKVGGGDVVFKIGFGDVIFSHEKHVEMGFSCKVCHPEPYVTKETHKKITMAEMNKGKSCGKCHNGKEAFSTKGNCKTCHVKK